MVETKEPFVIDSLSKAEWAMKKIARLRAGIEEKKEQAAVMKSDVDEWLKNETTEAEKSLTYFETLLQSFAVRELAGGKKKSMKLPSGRIGFKAGSTRFIFDGEDAGNGNKSLTVFLKTFAPAYVETKETVKWGEFKKTLHVMEDGRVADHNGEVVPDMYAEQGEDEFFVKAAVTSQGADTI